MIFKDKLILIPWVLSIVATVFAGSVAVVKFGGDSAQFTINYDYALRPFLSNVYSLYSALGILVGLILLNFALTYYIYPRKRFLSRLISMVTLAVSLIFFITIFSLTSIN